MFATTRVAPSQRLAVAVGSAGVVGVLGGFFFGVVAMGLRPTAWEANGLEIARGILAAMVTAVFLARRESSAPHEDY